MADKPEHERTEDGYLPMPLILCNTTRPHSFTRPVPVRDQIKHMLATIKSWFQVAR
jgi:hypothetical protein